MPVLTVVLIMFRRDEAQQSSVPQQPDQEKHEASQTQQQARSQLDNLPPGTSLMQLCDVTTADAHCP